MVVLRESDLPLVPRRAVAQFVMDAIRGRALFLVSNDASLAIELGADGVLIEEADKVAVAREELGREQILGVIALARDWLDAAESAGADFVLLNLDWSNPEVALETISRIRDCTSIPLIAGIDPPLETVAGFIEIGGAAVLESGMSAYNRTEAVRRYADALGIKS